MAKEIRKIESKVRTDEIERACVRNFVSKHTIVSELVDPITSVLCDPKELAIGNLWCDPVIEVMNLYHQKIDYSIEFEEVFNAIALKWLKQDLPVIRYEFFPSVSFLSWLRKVWLRKARDIVREDARRRTKCSAIGDLPLESAISIGCSQVESITIQEEDLMSIILKARLKNNEACVFEAIEFQGKTTKELAEELCISPQWVGKLRKKAAQKVKAAYLSIR